MSETREQAIGRIANQVQILNQCRWSEAMRIATLIYDGEYESEVTENGL